MKDEYDLRILSLGAGVQSTAVFLMALEGEFDMKIDCAIFADTGWEPAEIYDHLVRLEERAANIIPVYRVSRGDLRADVLRVVGPASQRIGRVVNPPYYVRQDDAAAIAAGRPPDTGGLLWRGCTKKYKIEPIQKKIRQLLGYQPRQRVKKQIQQWFGISTDEASRMKDSRVAWIDNYYPLIERMMSRADCLKWLTDHGYDAPRKSACIGCPYHSNAAWAEMRDHRPEEWKDALEFDHALRQGKLPGVTGDAYVHRKMMPLEVAVDCTHDPDQMDFFDNECEGMCGL
jgi:hypothetical protein